MQLPQSRWTSSIQVLSSSKPAAATPDSATAKKIADNFMFAARKRAVVGVAGIDLRAR